MQKRPHRQHKPEQDRDDETWNWRGILAMLFCFSGSAQTINIIALDQDGVETILQAAKESALQRNAPSAIAVVDHAGDLVAFLRMDAVRPASADLAIEKARTAARLQRPTEKIEENINRAERRSSPPASRRFAAACRYA